MVELVVPGDPGYQSVVADLTVSAHPTSGSPAAVLFGSDRSEVAESVRWAHERGLRIRVRSGGHHLSLPEPQGDTAVLDLSGVKDFVHDRPGEVIWCGAGLTSLETADALAGIDRAFPVGHHPTVGIGGFLLSGGHGWNLGGWGLAAHRLVALELITASGDLVVVDDHSHPDVMAAARGAGCFFGGIVHRFAVRTVPPPESIHRHWWSLRATDAAALGDVLDQLRPILSPEVEVTCFVHRRNGPVEIEVVASVFLTGGRETSELLQPFDAVGRLARDEGGATVGDLAELLGGMDPHRGDAMVSDQVWSHGRGADVFPALVAAATESPTDSGSILVSASAADAVTAPSRQCAGPGSIGIAAYGHWVPGGPGCDGTEEPHRTWVRSTVDRVPGGSGSYVGEADLGRPDAVARCFTPAGWELVRTTNARYASEGLFPAQR